MRCVSVAIGTLALSAGPAHAAPKAAEFYARGKLAFEAKQYHAAIILWRDGFAMSHEPGFLFILGQAYRLNGDCETAVTTYRRFITLDPDPTSEEHTVALGWIRELEPTCKVSSTQPIVDSRPSDDGRNQRIGGLVIGGSGVAMLAIGLVLGVHASALGDEVTRACSMGCDWRVESSKDLTGRRDTSMGYGLDAVGVAAIAGGAFLYYLGTRDRPVSVGASIGDGGASVSWSRSW